MMSTSLRLSGDMRGLVMGLRQFTMNSATNPGNLNMNTATMKPGNISVNLASNRQFSAAPSPAEIPKRPNTPWVMFFKANLPEYRKRHTGVKVSDLMSKISEEWKNLPAHKKVKDLEWIKSSLLTDINCSCINCITT